MSKERARCGATFVIDGATFHCRKNAGHKGPHEEDGDVGSSYRQYLMRWRGDCRETCETCGARSEHLVKCINCDSEICLNCREPRAVEQLRNVCKECPPDEEGD